MRSGATRAQPPPVFLAAVLVFCGVSAPSAQAIGPFSKVHLAQLVLPGGKAALFTIRGPSGRHDEQRIALLSLETGTWRVILEGGTFARYLPPGYLVFTRYGSLLAVPFDLRRLEVTGEPMPVLEGVSMSPNAEPRT